MLFEGLNYSEKRHTDLIVSIDDILSRIEESKLLSEKLYLYGKCYILASALQIYDLEQAEDILSFIRNKTKECDRTLLQKLIRELFKKGYMEQ